MHKSIREKYQLKEVTLSLSGHQIRVAFATNIDDLLEALIAKGDDHEDVRDERIPYFADLWPSSIVLAEQLVTHPEWVKEQAVLELGCGIGLAGTAAGLAGASSVLQTDYLLEAIEFASFIWKLNHDSPPITRLLDWRNPEDSFSRPVILAADVAYEERNFRPLIQTFRSLLPREGTLLLTEPSRQVAKPFVKMLEFSGFSVQTSLHPISFRGLNHRILLHRIRHASF